jgi:hypothetical protein
VKTLLSRKTAPKGWQYFNVHAITHHPETASGYDGNVAVEMAGAKVGEESDRWAWNPLRDHDTARVLPAGPDLRRVRQDDPERLMAQCRQDPPGLPEPARHLGIQKQAWSNRSSSTSTKPGPTTPSNVGQVPDGVSPIRRPATHGARGIEPWKRRAVRRPWQQLRLRILGAAPGYGRGARYALLSALASLKSVCRRRTTVRSQGRFVCCPRDPRGRAWPVLRHLPGSLMADHQLDG